MNARLAIGVLIGLVAAQLWAQEKKPAATKTDPKSAEARASYALGASAGHGIRTTMEHQALDLDLNTVLRGFSDALAGKPSMTDQEIMQAFQDLQKQISERNSKVGEAFLAANKKKPGVTELPSGLQYKIIRKGNGKKPKLTDTVVAHYSGKFINGKEFDSSYKRKEPTTFPVSKVIPGWVEALQLMDVGSKWELYVPSQLAYGTDGNEAIGPNSTLVFEVELVDIGQGAAAGPGGRLPPKNGRTPEEIPN